LDVIRELGHYKEEDEEEDEEGKHLKNIAHLNETAVQIMNDDQRSLRGSI
jgi:hypothetical protein